MATNEQIKANAKLIYAALPDARFSKATVLALAKCLDERLTWDEIPPEVKVCVMRLAMALDTEEEISRIQNDGGAADPARPAVREPDAPPPAPAPTPIKPDAVLTSDSAEPPPGSRSAETAAGEGRPAKKKGAA